MSHTAPTNENGDELDIVRGRYGAIQEQHGWFWVYADYNDGFEQIGLLGPSMFYAGNSIQQAISLDLLRFLHFVVESNQEKASLISAASDMLAALKRIVNDSPEPGEDAVLTAEGYNQACAAIAKATEATQMPDDKISFTSNEQNALAQLCEMLAKASYDANTSGRSIDDAAVLDTVYAVAEIFHAVNWGNLYDKFHRQGVNR